ncbi:hypothetical protein [Nocardioides sp. Root140]|uniref:hypothetical protein n=1 Tax=Nocardioides sp. Root140 TaxID=1736460 RepID=UPI000B221053|nr:hypothetical protein [Nocardioides sp. Root140]
MEHIDDAVTQLTSEQCWALLEGEEFGRFGDSVKTNSTVSERSHRSRGCPH